MTRNFSQNLEERYRRRLHTAEQSLYENQSCTSYILGNVPASVFMLGGEGRLTFFSGGETLHPLLNRAAAGKCIFILLGDSADIRRDLERALAG